MAGLGNINLTDKIGLNYIPLTKSFTTKALIVDYHLVGAFTTAAVIH